MPRTLQTALPPMELNALDDVRPRAAKATLDRQASSIGLTDVMKDALLRHYGSLKAAAITFGMDQGQLTRELQTGDFKLKRLAGDPAALAVVANSMQDAFGTLQTPHAHARRMIREMRQRLDELDQFVDTEVA